LPLAAVTAETLAPGAGNGFPTDSGGDAQDITFAWTRHAVDTIHHVCLALDELVATRAAELETMISA